MRISVRWATRASVAQFSHCLTASYTTRRRMLETVQSRSSLRFVRLSKRTGKSTWCGWPWTWRTTSRTSLGNLQLNCSTRFQETWVNRSMSASSSTSLEPWASMSKPLLDALWLKTWRTCPRTSRQTFSLSSFSHSTMAWLRIRSGKCERHVPMLWPRLQR